ncbi:ABC-type branched-subunit amino acid transport system permease subunit [Amorphus sp. MBR-141]
MATVISILVDTIAYTMVLFTMAIGLSITLGLMKLVNLAHGGFAMIGGFIASYAIVSLGVPFWPALLLAIVATVIVAIPIEIFLFRPIYGKGDPLAQVLITIGLAFCMIGVANLIFGPTIKIIPLPEFLSGPVDLGFRHMPAHRLFVVPLGLAVAFGLWFLIERTSFGVRLRASVDNSAMAMSLGIRTERIYSLTFALSVALGALGGIFGAELMPIEPHYALRYMVILLVVVSLGGAGSIGGALLATLFLSFVQTAGKYLLPGYGDILFYAAVILCVLVFPHGLLGRKTPHAHVPTPATDISAPSRRTGYILVAAIVVIALIAHNQFPTYAGFFSRIISLSLLAISLDLVVGFCGIATLGQATFYGVGAYAAGILAVRLGITDPVAMMAGGAAFGALSGVLFGAIVVRASGLAQLVLTVAIVELVNTAANKLTWLTGGSDGLAGVSAGPLFGVFAFDFRGHTGFYLSLAVLAIVLVLLVTLVNAPFGLLCRAIKGDQVRVESMGGSVRGSLVSMFAVSGAVAGIGGALVAINTSVVGLDSLTFTRSAEVFVMLIVGGAGTLFGAVAGTVLYLFAEHSIAVLNPFHWLIAIGGLLIVMVFALPTGLQGIAIALYDRLGRRRPEQPAKQGADR